MFHNPLKTRTCVSWSVNGSSLKKLVSPALLNDGSSSFMMQKKQGFVHVFG